MTQKEVLSMLVVIFFVASILSMISLFYMVNKTTISGKVSEGTLSIVINNVCGNNICVGGENCSADASNCTDNLCYEPTCTNGCGQTLVANGFTDEVCTGNTGCVGGNCACDGLGNCIAGGAPSVGGPSGGGGSSIGGKVIGVVEERTKAVVKVNEIFKQRVTIVNFGELSTKVSIDVIGLENIIRVINPVFSMGAGETHIVVFDVLAKNAGVYTGQLVIRTKEGSVFVPVIIEAETKQVLFDLSLDIKPKLVVPGEKISVQATLFNLNEIGLVNVEVSYIIKDFEDKTILEENEMVSIETQATLVKTFTIPEDIAFGEYVFIVQVSYGGTVGTSSELFTVGKLEAPAQTQKTNNLLLMGIVIIIIVLSVIGFFMHKKISRIVKLEKTKIKKLSLDKTKVIQTEMKKKEFLNKRAALEKAYRSAYISEKAYEEGKKDIERALRKIGNM